MKPKEKKPEIVFRIIDRKSGDAVGSYSRAYCDEYDFESVNQARSANVHGVFEDKKKYKIAEYKVTYTLIKDDCKAETMNEQGKRFDELIKKVPKKLKQKIRSFYVQTD